MYEEDEEMKQEPLSEEDFRAQGTKYKFMNDIYIYVNHWKITNEYLDILSLYFPRKPI